MIAVGQWGWGVQSMRLRGSRRPRLELTLAVLNMATYAAAALAILAAA